MHIRILLALVAAVLVTSCGTAKLSTKELSDVEAGRKAIVRADNNPLLIDIILVKRPVVKILKVDGREVSPRIFSLNEQIAVDVGVHEIEFSCTDRAGYNEKDFTEMFTMDLKPYHIYLVDCWFESGIMIEEKRIK